MDTDLGLDGDLPIDERERRVTAIRTGLGSVAVVWILSIASWAALVSTIAWTFDLGSLGTRPVVPAWVRVVEVVASGGSVGAPLVGAAACWVVGFHAGEQARSLVPFGAWIAFAGTVPLVLLATFGVFLA